MASELRKRQYLAASFLAAITCIGTIGYFTLGRLTHQSPPWRLDDCLYMTVITLTTVGFGEIIDIAKVPGARLFTVFILFSGLGIAAYSVSTLTAFLVEGELTNVFWRKRMDTLLRSMSQHLILCGLGRVSGYIIQELHNNHIDFVVVDRDEARIKKLQAKYGEFPAVIGDATHAKYLSAAEITKAQGIIATLDDDKDNLCVVVTARQLNPRLNIISTCTDPEFQDKLDLLGADVVMPNAIGGMRMASQMIRPKVVGYLDLMLRDKRCLVRIENLILTKQSNLVGQPLSAIDFDGLGQLLVLALIRDGESSPVYNPDRATTLAAGDTLIVQADIEALANFKRQHL